MEGAIRDGVVAPGALLPTVRGLAADLQVAPGTVAAAYRTLRERGLVQSGGRRGTRVRPGGPAERGSPVPPLPAGSVDLSTGLPDPDLLPPLRDALLRLARQEPVAASPAAAVLPRLEQLARGRLERDAVAYQALTVTSGALDALQRVLSGCLRPGDAVAVEDPGWPSLLDLVAGLGLRCLPMGLDEDGPLPGSLAAALSAGARAVVLTSRAQNPSGAAVTAGRRDQLRDVLAGAPETLVIEDDHAADLADVPLAVVAGTTRAWAFVRSLSKPYGPDLRVALCAGDAATVSTVEASLRQGPGWVSSLLQALVAALWEDAEVDRLVVRAAGTYTGRRTRLLAELTGRGIAARGRTGINVWVPVPDEPAVVNRLVTAGWLVAPGSRFRLGSPPGVRISLGGLADSDLLRLADAVADAVAGGRRPTYSA